MATDPYIARKNAERARRNAAAYERTQSAPPLTHLEDDELERMGTPAALAEILRRRRVDQEIAIEDERIAAGKAAQVRRRMGLA